MEKERNCGRGMEQDMEIIDIKKKIENNGLVKWQEGMARKSTLQWYRWKQKPEGVTWHVGDWGSKLLYKARTGTLEVNGRNRELENQNCSCRVGEKETVKHVIVECNKYRSQRERPIASIVIVLGREEWDRRLEQKDGALCTVLRGYHTVRFVELFRRTKQSFGWTCLPKH